MEDLDFSDMNLILHLNSNKKSQFSPWLHLRYLEIAERLIPERSGDPLRFSTKYTRQIND
jgi:hypothetical protein